VVRGSAFETTVLAAISSPLSSSTPVARPFSTQMRATGASVRISAPKPVAARCPRLQHGVGGARLLRTLRHAQGRVRPDRSFHHVRFEVLVQDVGGGHGQDSQQLRDPLAAEPASRAEQPDGRAQVREDHLGEIQWRHVGQRAHHARQGLHELDEHRIRFGIGPGESRDLLDGPRRIAVDRQLGAVWLRTEGDHLRIDRLDVGVQLEIASYGGGEIAPAVGHGRHLEAGQDLLGDGGAAHEGAPFQDQDLSARLGEIACGGQPVVSRPNDDRVVVAQGPLSRVVR